jgi:hypothetical protein
MGGVKMLKRLRLAAGIWALTSMTASAWAQAVPGPIAACCLSEDNNQGQNIARDCTTTVLSPAAVNNCKTISFYCGPGQTVECAPPISGDANKKDCSCNTFSYGD